MKHPKRPKLTDKNRAAVERCLDAFNALQEIDPEFAFCLIQEIALAMRDPEEFIAACAPSDRDDAREMIYGPRSKQ